jgi:hypothetical protein
MAESRACCRPDQIRCASNCRHRCLADHPVAALSENMQSKSSQPPKEASQVSLQACARSGNQTLKAYLLLSHVRTNGQITTATRAQQTTHRSAHRRSTVALPRAQPDFTASDSLRYRHVRMIHRKRDFESESFQSMEMFTRGCALPNILSSAALIAAHKDRS